MQVDPWIEAALSFSWGRSPTMGLLLEIPWITTITESCFLDLQNFSYRSLVVH